VTELESGIATRAVTSGDSDFLWQMICLAAVWDDPDKYTVDELKARPKVASYLDLWEERGIFGLVVVDGVRSVGAAWCSFAESAEEIFGFSARDVPVMVMALEPDYRDRHLGRWLLTELITLAKSRGHRRMSLEVDAGNDRGRHLYESLGFREERIEPDGSAVMVADF
jgi:ribosomal protein S18 acetylase RimI-like enzyme